MKYLLSGLITVALVISAFEITNAQGASGFSVAKTFHIASGGGWDYIAVGPNNNRLYVSHATQVNILNQETGDSVGVIEGTTGVHGIAFAMDRGYTSNGRLNNVTVFDLKTNQIITQIATGENPDAIMFDEFSKKIITCNGRSKNLSVIDPATDKVVATIPVAGKPETAVSDNAGKIFVNIEDKNQIDVVDIAKNKVVASWSIAPADGPTGLAIDIKTKRLFAGCDKLLVVVDATNGKIVDKLPIADGCDGVGFDNGLKYVFASCGEGKLSVIEEMSADKFKVIDNVETKRSARTIAVDETKHEVYMPAADSQPGTAGERPKMVPGTFQVLVVKKK
ncbi:MAG TPA: cytochrome D1 domain-containing protein [Puia sp.]|nr:cytochrome D1 domain-containing protein [Puia sp.]